MSFIAAAILVYTFFYLYINYLRNRFIQEFNSHLNEFCQNLGTVVYRSQVSIPYQNGVYEKSLALALLDIAFNVSNSNCQNILPLPNPPKFTQQLRIEGVQPISGDIVMFAYIFWDQTLQHACIAFTGTKFISEWQSDFQFEQVAPTVLNGYENGVLVHMGIYNIYLSIRDKLWNWWKSNQSWVKTLYITGHSLGGGLSTICSYDFAKVFTNNFPVHYSFAAPRTGNPDYAQLFNDRLPTSIRVNNTEDLIPQLPLAQQKSYTYEQTGGNAPFTVSLGSLEENHIQAYQNYLPICPESVSCHVDS